MPLILILLHYESIVDVILHFNIHRLSQRFEILRLHLHSPVLLTSPLLLLHSCPLASLSLNNLPVKPVPFPSYRPLAPLLSIIILTTSSTHHLVKSPPLDLIMLTERMHPADE